MAKRPSGVGGYVSHARRQAAGRVRVEVYLDATEAACLVELEKLAGSKRQAVAQAILDAFERIE